MENSHRNGKKKNKKKTKYTEIQIKHFSFVRNEKRKTKRKKKNKSHTQIQNYFFSFCASRLQQLQQMQQFETQQQPQQEYSQQSSKSPVQSQSQQQLQQTTNNINRKLNGFLNLKTPLIGYVLIDHWLIDSSVFAWPNQLHTSRKQHWHKDTWKHYTKPQNPKNTQRWVEKVNTTKTWLIPIGGKSPIVVAIAHFLEFLHKIRHTVFAFAMSHCHHSRCT